MPTCYAEILSDCAGPIETEHFVSLALQKMLGKVSVGGLAWQDHKRIEFLPGAYAKSRILCRYHHDELDGLDGNALSYFQNLMLIANSKHISSGRPGHKDDIALLVDGRALEKWFLKLICGAIRAKSIQGVAEIPATWIHALFNKVSWPDGWPIYVRLGEREIAEQDAGIQLDFLWRSDKRLNGLVLRAFSVETIFALEAPDDTTGLLKRPRVLGAQIQRPDGGDILEGIPRGEDIRFQISWPDRPLLDLSDWESLKQQVIRE